MFFSYAHIFAWLIQYKYLLLFPIMVAEGPIITVIAGFLCSLKYMDVSVVMFLSVLGDIVGDGLYYALGRWGRRRLIERWGHFVGLTQKRIENTERYFEKHAGKTLITAKLTHAAGLVANVSAGVARMPFWFFIWYNFLGTVPKSLFFVVIGYYFGSMYQQINGYIDRVSLIIVGVFLLVAILIFLRKRNRSHSRQNP